MTPELGQFSFQNDGGLTLNPSRSGGKESIDVEAGDLSRSPLGNRGGHLPINSNRVSSGLFCVIIMVKFGLSAPPSEKEVIK